MRAAARMLAAVGSGATRSRKRRSFQRKSVRITDVTLANELAAAHREDPEAVADLLNASEPKPTRAAVKAIRRKGWAKQESPETPPDAAQQSSPDETAARAVLAQCSTHVFLTK